MVKNVNILFKKYTELEAPIKTRKENAVIAEQKDLTNNKKEEKVLNQLLGGHLYEILDELEYLNSKHYDGSYVRSRLLDNSLGLVKYVRIPEVLFDELRSQAYQTQYNGQRQLKFLESLLPRSRTSEKATSPHKKYSMEGLRQKQSRPSLSEQKKCADDMPYFLDSKQGHKKKKMEIV